GALHAAVAILAALHERERNGTGTRCDVSMTDGLVAWMAPLLVLQQATGEHIGPHGTVLNGRHPCYRIYRCADGFLSLGALEPRFWKAFVEAIGLPDLESEQFADGEACDSAVAIVERVLTTRSRAEWQRAFAGRDVCCEPVLQLDEVLQHEQVVARSLQLSDGIAIPFRTGATPSQQRPSPGFGEHTREVLLETYSAAEVDSLLGSGAAR
ncbi:MAG: CoA transferase, partial [Candidatus Dormibacteraeota bacterium]|nr:CoA transferase [Candidatus Dormibacteraeota bacterium]